MDAKNGEKKYCRICADIEVGDRTVAIIQSIYFDRSRIAARCRARGLMRRRRRRRSTSS
jgi:hypothetical protein